jgi:pimeloyl-ACP methyl ester carboxylesterase
MSYSFKELADDVAAFVHAMGYETAHIIGHSNGGNVALVTLMEHPEVVQTCIPQAANAYVTRYLIEREPKVFDPDRVEREAPQWRDEMIKLHSEINGEEYWRELLWLTMREIISEPNYSPAELARVEKPTLVIMGAEDRVNAPDEHAQYIVTNNPDAELWIPEKTGHNVHLERREEWIAKVLDFLERRG